jgi:UDP-2-acetamido-2-deoxy-ribo-hexuluronate aminotransferase
MMQFIDLKTQYKRIQAEIQNRMQQVFEHGTYIMGPEVGELEEQLAEYTQAKHCIAVASGTDALLVAMMALGMQPGDEVITTPFTFIATAEMIRILGARPVFVDIDPHTYNINTALIEQAITPKTRVILPVNLYGQCADYDEINAIATKHNLVVIEDAAQSFGATYKGRYSCGLAAIGCASFFPAKPLGCYGDGGACFTNDDDLADKMRKICNHGQSTRYNHVILGLNSRLDSLQAAILLAKLEIFSDEVARRQTVAQMYDRLLKDDVTIPYIAVHNRSVYAQYTIQIENRDQVQQKLTGMGIPTAVHYPVPLHKQPIFADLNWNNLSVSEYLADRVMSLPFHPYLDEKNVEKIANLVIKSLS